jgi:hypothetical protein
MAEQNDEWTVVHRYRPTESLKQTHPDHKEEMRKDIEAVKQLAACFFYRLA